MVKAAKIIIWLTMFQPLFVYAGCESIDTTRSSWIEGSKYCEGSLTIDMGDKIYTYNNVSESDWRQYKDANSLGSSFNQVIKNNYNYSNKTSGIKYRNDLE